MNFLYILLLFVIPAAMIEQDSLFPLNESGKIAFEEEVSVEGMGKDALFVNAINYAGMVKKAGERKARKPSLDKDGLSKDGSFYVYKKGLFTPQIHGEINYRIRIEPKDGGYKYSITDLVFQFYEKNRYGQYAPVSGKLKPLEEEKYAGMQDLWEEHRKLTREVMDNHIRVLKKKMQEIPPGARLNKENRGDERN